MTLHIETLKLMPEDIVELVANGIPVQLTYATMVVANAATEKALRGCVAELWRLTKQPTAHVGDIARDWQQALDAAKRAPSPDPQPPIPSE